MPLPEPEWLSLCEAAHRLVDRCEVTLNEAKSWLDRAFREASLALFDLRFAKIIHREGATLDWKNNAFLGNPHLGYTIEGVRVARPHQTRR